MPTSVFISVTATDVARSAAFYEAIGLREAPAFASANGRCFVIDDHVSLMVLQRDFFAAMTDKTVADPRTSALVGLNLIRPSREDVDAAAERGLAAGGTQPRAAEDHEGMYSRDLDDPDGNNVGLMWMAPAPSEEDAPART